MIGALDIQRLAVRIETLQRISTHGWNPADEIHFKNLLPTGRLTSKLPDPKMLRELADSGHGPRWPDWQGWVTDVRRCEDFQRDNDPRNPKRMMRDMARGKFPGIR